MDNNNKIIKKWKPIVSTIVLSENVSIDNINVENICILIESLAINAIDNSLNDNNFLPNLLLSIIRLYKTDVKFTISNTNITTPETYTLMLIDDIVKGTLQIDLDLALTQVFQQHSYNVSINNITFINNQIILKCTPNTTKKKFIIPTNTLCPIKAEQEIAMLIADYKDNIAFDNTTGLIYNDGSKDLLHSNEYWFADSGDSKTINNVTPLPNFQECSHLEIEDVFNTSENTLKDLYNLQKDIQENVYGYDFNKLQSGPLPELRQFWDWNYHAIQDELREAFTALGGMSDGISNGVWKPWKKSYTEQAPNMTYNDMSERDKKELKMELIDIQHFLFNIMLSVGMTEQELMNFYFAKNQENRRRNASGTY
jgi:hypothetical protein